MSTFDGRVIEFPEIQIDYFRRDQSRPALAFFLSHVHSDHLQGLESFKGSFIYCSLATREVLLRLEKYPRRMNFTKGILESRVQSYKHLKSILKPLPLETPTMIELSPGRSIRVTTFDANHCVGAVMFLIEGHGKAILYTGDIRSEAWWVNSLCRSPTLIPYVVSRGQHPLRHLDKIYLDTTFASKKHRYQDFPSKADGVKELLHKVSSYPKDTAFYFDSWTFGYEEVWQALAGFLGSQIHVDDYRYKLYLALANTTNDQGKPQEAFRLIGSNCGNHFQEGCLTTKQTRLHSCEQGAGCGIWKQNFVRITPVVSRSDGIEIAEPGAGGGQGDLRQQHILELGDDPAAQKLIALCSAELSKHPRVLERVIDMLQSTILNPRNDIHLENTSAVKGSLNSEGIEDTEIDSVPLSKLISALAQQAGSKEPPTHPPLSEAGQLPQRITFPYSRHSSYHELCLLIDVFRPRDIHPCTVDKQNWDWTKSMSHLFGHLYDEEKTFAHDRMMLAQGSKKRQQACMPTHEPSTAELSRQSRGSVLRMAKGQCPAHVVDLAMPRSRRKKQSNEMESDESVAANSGQQIPHHADDNDRHSDAMTEAYPGPETRVSLEIMETDTSTCHQIAARDELDLRIRLRQEAYDAALGNDGASWFDIGLVSVHGHQTREGEL